MRFPPAFLRHLPFALLLLPGGCIMVPVTTSHYDPACRTTARHMALRPLQLGYIRQCSNEGCAAVLAAAGATAAASAVVSGSIMVVGNVVYWMEKQGHCHPDDAPGAHPPAAGTASAPAEETPAAPGR